MRVNAQMHNLDKQKTASSCKTFSNGENIEIENLKQGLSYVIDITDGEIIYLEFITYGENWNGIFGEYKIVEKSENQ